jgi:glycosyltransferase involved in cell wall biosynthesis
MVVENLSLPFDRRVWKECCALRDQGYVVSAISPRGSDCDTASRETIDGIDIYRYSAFDSTGGTLSYALEFGVALLMTSLLAWVIFFRRGFDVIHLSNPPDLLIFAALPFKLFGKRIIFDQHDLSPEIYSEHRRNAEGGFVHRALLAFEYVSYRCADVVICITQSICEIAAVRGRVRREDIFLVRNGPDLASFAGATADTSLRHGRQFQLTYVGMMGPQDGVDILLRAMKAVVADLGRDDVHLHVVGGGTELPHLRKYADALGIADYVTFAGKQDYQRVVTAIASADVCVCPDPKTPMNDRANLVKLSEYMCLGKPVVAFDLMEVRHSAGDAATYATPNDERELAAKIDFLLRHPEERARLGEIAARRVRERLSWDHSKTALYAAYERVFAKGGVESAEYPDKQHVGVRARSR